MVALRVYADLLDRLTIDTLGQPYEVAVIEAADHKTEVLALAAMSSSPRPLSPPRSNSAPASG